MKLYEYQSKSLFAQYGIPIPRGRLATTPQEVYEIACEFNYPVTIKSQVLEKNWEKANRFRTATDPEEARQYAVDMLDIEIKGTDVKHLLVEIAPTVTAEFYLAITYDQDLKLPILIASDQASSMIEPVKLSGGSHFLRENINPFIGILDYQTREIASSINLAYEHWKGFTEITKDLFNCYVSSDALFAEINPLALTRDNHFLALDGKIILDDQTMYRQPDIARMRDDNIDDAEQKQARVSGIRFLRLDGQIGCLVNGIGLAMTLADLLPLYGDRESKLANFIDIGSGAQSHKANTALRIILSDPKVKVVLVNIFGGITRCDDVARGIVQTLTEISTDIPIIIRFAGTNADEGNAVIQTGNHSNIFIARNLTDAMQQAIAAARRQPHGYSRH